MDLEFTLEKTVFRLGGRIVSERTIYTPTSSSMVNRGWVVLLDKWQRYVHG